MDLQEAVKPHPLGCIISFEVVPGCTRMAVPSGFNSWRRALEARLTEEPTRGRANRQLAGQIAAVLGLAATDVEVLSGQKSPRKVLLARGISSEEAVAALQKRMIETAGQKD
ncbi:MAG TPA: DUF167 family protein [Methanothrix sp.]|nr:DUF167 domain-containing protein [Methanothrix sp.]HOV81145.1 DUF167 family protein [Methanothrix sp.]HPC88936.1 DUF167 family protein [Methanothrix sp.]HQE86870.1 DUF167 family protein [Methanothrix sp.]HQI67519.1 DUF167 family protein [Methanothrix sp.]